MIDVLVEVIGCNEVRLFLIKGAALIQAVQPDVAGDVLICQESADAERTAHLIRLAFGETEFGLEGFEQPFHLLSAFLYTSAIHKYDRKIHG